MLSNNEENSGKEIRKESGLKPFIATMAAESNLRKQEYLKKGVIRLNPNALPQLHLDFD